MRKSALHSVMLLILLVGTVFCAGEAGAAAQTPYAVRGVLDATGWSMERDGDIPLDGEWEFYWNRLLDPHELNDPSSLLNPSYVKVPKEWRSYTIDAKPLSNEGYATYRLRIGLAPEELHKHEALYISGVATAYRLWIDGILAASNGTVGTSRDSMIPRNYAKIVTFTPDKQEIELVLQVSNFVQRKGGLWAAIRLGSEQQMSYERDKRVTVEASLSASLAIMGLYHLVLFLLRRKDKSPLFFGALCLLIAVRTLFVGEALAIRLFPDISWEWGAKLEYLGVLLGIAMVMALVYAQYPGEMGRKLRNAAVWISVCCAAAVLATTAGFYTRLMLAFQLWILLCFGYVAFVYVLALLRRKEAAGSNCVALFLFIAAAVNDTLYYNHVVATGDSFPLGLVGALFMQSFVLSRKFSRSFKQVEKLSDELAIINETLEEKIKERTVQLRQSVAGLQKANDELSQLEGSRRRLMSGISHELGTPLTLIQGYVNGMMDGVIDPGDPKYLRLIYEKTVHLDRIIGDLMELSRLEARQMAFLFEPLPAEDYFRHIYDKYELELHSNGLQFEWSGLGTAEESPESGGAIAVFSGDPLRVEQVVSNLLTNATKFTSAGGTIRMELRYEPEPGSVVLRVSDTGEGIPEEDLPFIFDRFYRGKGSKERRAVGTGLGLAIAKEIVEAHGGTIGVESEPGQGSTFYFKLPAWHESPGGSLEGEAG
ncbi:hypothetical protein SD70_18120 [Gordoniibacillus kamchatkensis]|uniref:histidine kinase n=1 Tax=Gordoniibacillus kamchatkensis TaxID=1590651 RepID=A0ABR5AF51_9BACL|nr:sensor histidine kinase [Paenibacillus sp. VKM B-2647]KIL39686.1 hypothetical protein SD70_18120 [Paenibacillus sp. VKM B-2647]